MTSIHHIRSVENTDEDRKRGGKSLRLRFASLWSRKPPKDNSFASHQGAIETASNPHGLRRLYAPENPLVDFIFVHGLRGGSMKTWCIDGNPETFWPMKWLPEESDFEHVRISSFGYPSDWTCPESSHLNLDDFARNLFTDIRASDYLGRDASTPIVLVGHSMGGLVIKQAYILAIEQHQLTAQRIKSMVFLATPHRGSDIASIASALLEWAGANKQYVEDLERNSVALKRINDAFRSAANAPSFGCALNASPLEIHSMYEVQKLNPRFFARLIVPEDSAVLGYPGESISWIYANHRTICKFSSREDNNYTILRTRLGAIAQSMTKRTTIVENERKTTQMQELRILLHRPEGVQRDFDEHLARKTPRSCEWVETRTEFQEWRDCSATPRTGHAIDNTWSPSATTFKNNLKVYWLTAKAGAGKSVCSAHVIAHLRSRNLDCAYYFFKSGDKLQQGLCHMLRSIAYQMADQHPQIRMRLLEARNAGLIFDDDCAKVISSKLYAELIFKFTSSLQMQYWVLDAMDECNVDSRKEFVNFLASVPGGFGLRVFVTSRPGVEPKHHFETSGAADKLIVEPILSVDTQRDMLLYLKSHMVGMSIGDLEHRNDLRNRLLVKSNDCFLWLNLVRQELEETYSTNSIAEVLDEIPTEMSDWYERCFRNLSNTLRKDDLLLSQALFTRVICAIRPLQLEELFFALRDEMIARFHRTERTPDKLRCIIPSLSGFLLYVDHNDNVQLCHSTVCDFLVNQSHESNYFIESSAGHQKLLTDCFQCMRREFVRQNSRTIEDSRTPSSRKSGPFTSYASVAFSDHLAASSSRSISILEAVFEFLTQNVLPWVEHVVLQRNSLDCLIRTARNLRNYAERLKKHVAPLSLHFKTVEQWSIDLVRLVAKFGHNLKRYPGTIHTVIPSIAPRASLLYQQKYNQPDEPEIVGPAGQSWNDCAAVIHGGDIRVTGLTCGQQFFAVGHKNGSIVLYDHATYEETQTIKQVPSLASSRELADASNMKPNPIKLIAVNESGTLIASADLRQVYIWSLEGDLVRCFTLNEPCMLLAFSIGGDDIIIVTRSSCILRLAIHGGSDVFNTLVRDIRRPSANNIGQAALKIPRQAPIAAALSPDQLTVALLYRGRPIYLCDPEDNSVLGRCGRDVDSKSSNISVQTALFNPNHDLHLLAVSYQDGELALYNSFTREELLIVSGNAYTLASSPDGQTLGSGDTRGTISLWDFETLTLLHQIKSGLDEIRTLAFTSDNSRLVDLRDSKINIWEPTALVRKSVLEDASMSDALPLPASVVGENEEIITLTAMCYGTNGDFIFAGRSDGSVAVYTTASGTVQSIIVTHAGNLFVSTIAFRNNIIATADAGGRILVHTFHVTSDNRTITPALILDIRQSEPVQSLVVSEDGSRLLVATLFQITTWNLETGLQAAQHLCSFTDPIRNSTWAAGSASISAVTNRGNLPTLVTYDWDSFQIKHSAQLLEFPDRTAGVLTGAADDTVCETWGRYMIVYSSNPATLKTRSELVVYDKHTASTHEGPHRPIFKVPAAAFQTLIGIHLHHLVFLDPELWVCSVDLDQPAISGSNFKVKHHFFIPSDLLSGCSGLRPILSPLGDIVFAKEDQLAVIKGLKGLKMSV